MHSSYKPVLLIVEPDGPTQGSLTRHLQDDFNCFVVSSAREAKVIHQLEPAAVLIDDSGTGEGGLDLCAAMRAVHGQSMPIVLVSSDSSLATLKHLRSAGVSMFFSKPTTHQAIIDCLLSLLHAPARFETSATHGMAMA